MNESDRLCGGLSIVLLLAYAAIQGVAVTAPWFPADDAQELAFVRGMASWTSLFGTDSFGLFRPVKNLIFFAFARLEPLGMPAVRALAALIGLLSFFPVRALFRLVFARERLALAATALWLLAPTLVSSTVWLSCVNIQVMCALAAWALVLHARGRPGGAAACLLLACVSYEQAVAVGPCLVAFDFYLRPKLFRTRRAWLCYGLYALVTLAFLAGRQMIGAAHTVNGSFANCTRGDIAFAAAYLSGQHFLSWFWPFGRLAVFGGYVAGSVPRFALAAAWLLLAVLVSAAWLLRRRRPAVAFGLAFALIGFLPVSNVTGIGNGPYGDYYLSLPSIGLAALLAGLCATRASAALVALVRLAALVAAFHWAWFWSDGLRACFASAENFPSFFGNQIFLIGRLYDAGFREASLTLGRGLEEQVGSDSGSMSVVYLTRGLYAYEVEKDAVRALDLFTRSEKMSDFEGGRQNRDFYKACVYEDLLDDPVRAEELYAASLRGKWTVDSVPAADRLARLMALRGDKAAAIDLWTRALRLDPNNAGIRHNLAVTARSDAF